MRTEGSTTSPVVIELPKALPLAERVTNPFETTVSTPGNVSVFFATLPALEVFNVNTQRHGNLRLYDERGYLDESATRLADDLLADSRRKGQPITRIIERRLLQVLVRSVYHFRQCKVEIVSGFRQPTRRREGYHALGRAVDYRIANVDVAALASYLRTLPRLGVGVYTHPKTQYVHLDVRDVSYHWLDASPPRRHWRERSLGGRALVDLDKGYNRMRDWPEGYLPPPEEREKTQ